MFVSKLFGIQKYLILNYLNNNKSKMKLRFTKFKEVKIISNTV